MNTKQRFNVISNGDDDLSAPTRRTRHPVAVAIAILAAVLLLVAARWTHFDEAGGQPSAKAEVRQSGDGSAKFEYFPDQYVNQAKDPEEHIQAF